MLSTLMILFLTTLGIIAAATAENIHSKPLVLAVVGTNRDILKLSSIANLFHKYYAPLLDFRIVYTGELPATQLLPELAEHGMPPMTDLRTGTGEPELFSSRVTGALLKSWRGVDAPPAAVIVVGGSASALGAAVASLHADIPLIHIDAGSRAMLNLATPSLTEFHRRSISLIASLSLVPTASAKVNLLRNGVNPDTIAVVGSTVVDITREMLANELDEKVEEMHAKLEARRLIPGSTKARRYALVYVGSYREGVQEIASAVKILSSVHSTIMFYCVFEFNSSNSEAANVISTLNRVENIVILEQLPHTLFVRLLQKSSLLLTDSGSAQESSAAFAVPCIAIG